MIVTKEWLNEFISIRSYSTEEICKTLTSIGLEIGGTFTYKMPESVVIGKVLSCEKHPDATKLSVCQVDVGKEILQIVCGASNVGANMYVPVALVGAKIGELTIKDAELRGVKSSGMICSSTELGLPKLNDGILELDESIGNLTVGTKLKDINAFNDTVIEIDLTPNRGDCLSIYGITRELSAYYNITISPKEFFTNEHELSIGQKIDVNCDPKIETSLLYKVIDTENFKLPLLYKLRLAYVDEFNTLDIVNAVNYATYESGVILNCYDVNDAVVDKNGISLFTLKKDEKGFDCIYSDKKLSTLGIDKGSFDFKSTQILVEASYINPDFISKQVYETKIETKKDPFYRASRGSEPDINFGINNIASLFSKNGGKVFKGIECFLVEPNKISLDVSSQKVSSIIGQSISKIDMEKILKSLGFELKDHGSNTLNVTVPAFRHDIRNIADVTEEIVRIIGIDNIQAKPLAIDEVNRTNETSIMYTKLNQLRSNAINAGFFETITYIFSSRELLAQYGFDTVKEELDILNPITNELNSFRTTIALNLILAASHNVKMGFDKIAIFEIGSVFSSTREESSKISFLFSGTKESETFLNHGKPKNITFFEFANKIASVVGDFELEEFVPTHKFAHPYQSAKIIVEGKSIGEIYKLHPIVANEFDLNDTFIAEIDFDTIKSELVQAKSISKFQGLHRDLSLVVPKTIEYKSIKTIINSLNIKELQQFNLVDIYTDAKLGENESLTIRFYIQSSEKTLAEDDIVTIMDNILNTLTKELNIGLRQ
ncbi:phenylalanine--tRNA ligase subunit beta [Arcobacter sp. FWKO B]|uniref:phenylalanine--tRNA ligase subunit beta n=1 Tax=Arcobacter sp. FWKO B TaxID=2593672 RepID=UPI0018A69587|nr:phenylalanine--tRNA ligase subunit beta [Arcobacter sp. FWKO B]QOG12641.1 phenylalanine--tRNA ligase subunit beta [Arcobacter sp. FWKO B]